MKPVIHQFKTVGYSTVEAVLENADNPLLMICLHFAMYRDEPGQPTREVEVPPMAMTLDAALALCEGIRVRVEALKSERAERSGGPRGH